MKRRMIMTMEKRIPKTPLAAETIDELMNSLRGGETPAVPAAEPALPTPEETPGKDYKIKAVPTSPLSADTIREMLEKKRRQGGTSHSATSSPHVPTVPSTGYNPDKVKFVPTSPLSSSADPARAAALKELRDTLSSGKPMQLNPDGSLSLLGKKPDSDKCKQVPKSPLSATQWYQRDPALYAAEVAAMRDYLNDPTAQPEMLPDGRLCWDVTITPKIGNYVGADYRGLVIYDADHPNISYGSSARFYPLDPSVEELESLMQASEIVKSHCRAHNKTPHLPHTIRDDHGNRFLCNMDKRITTDDLSKGAISAASSCLCAHTYFAHLEGSVQDPGICALFFSH